MNKISFPLDKKKASNKTTEESLGSSIIAVGTETFKIIKPNQDACRKLFIEDINTHIVVIADGVGSSKHAEKGSEFVVNKAIDLFECEVKKGNRDIPFDSIFSEIQVSLDKYINEEYRGSNEDLKGAFGTTLIVGIDYPDKFVSAYIGNGSILHISGFFATFPKTVLIPWNAINILNPHTIERDGKESLFKIFHYNGESNTHKPSVIEIRKDSNLPGEIFVLTTDGVYSSDQLLGGKDDNGDIWIPSCDKTEILYQYLKDYLSKDGQTINQESLENMIDDYLKYLKDKKIMDDDTTLGVIISGKCQQYFINKKTN